MDKMSKKIVGVFAVIVVVAVVVLGIYYALNRQAAKEAEEDVLPKTEVGKILAKDLELKYPETPTEVLKLYWRINRCLYNESLSDDDFEAVLKQLRMLYDEEFLAEEDNSYDNMLKNFKKESASFKSSKQTMSACVVQENDTLDVKKLDGQESVTVITSTLMKAKGKRATKTYEKFICRRNENNKWKILGWQQTNADEAAKVNVE